MRKIVAICLLFFGCSDPKASECVEGQQIECACFVGSGIQQCSGRAYSDCVCPDDPTALDAGSDTLAETDLSSDQATGPEHDLMQRLLGLWIGSATDTPLGNFPLMNMDLRPVENSWLFSRVDLDEDNALRFGFYYETLNAEDHFVFRNGGLFMGLERDTKTVLTEFTNDTFTFCEPVRGCDYLTATWHLTSDSEVQLAVVVNGAQHLNWNARRVEERDSPNPFPESTEALGEDIPFPDMPTLNVTATVSQSISETSFIWLILSDTACGFTGRDCQASRSIRVEIPADSTSATTTIDQIHAGTYFVNAIWDLNGNFQARPFPDSGDQIATIDNTIVVTDGASLQVQPSITVP